VNGISRWLLVALLLGAVTALAFQRYQNEVSSLTPNEFGAVTASQSVRVLGRVQAGSLQITTGEARFILENEGAQVNVLYNGPDLDTLRELKTILIHGEKQADGSLHADVVSITPNYGFIVGAYGVAGVILLLFAFLVEARLRRMEKEFHPA
jgi:cytochrome c-type biogenesis protein CcmE